MPTDSPRAARRSVETKCGFDVSTGGKLQSYIADGWEVIGTKAETESPTVGILF